jgi:hypothetical protein
VLVDLVGELRGDVARLEVDATRIGRDGEARRHREPEVCHLGQVRALAPEQITLRRIAL